MSSFSADSHNIGMSLLSDEGRTIESVDAVRGHFYDILGNIVRVFKYTIIYTDGSSTVLNATEQIRYASTAFIPGQPAHSGASAFLEAVENHPPLARD